jgi:DNA-binding NarL/FixJ family response regulator
MVKTGIRILIVDDQPHVRKGLQALLETDERMLVIGFAANGVQAIGMAAEYIPDVILLDAYMPSLDGIEAALRIKEKNPTIRIILMGTEGDERIHARTETSIDMQTYVPVSSQGNPELPEAAFVYKDQSETALIELILQEMDRKERIQE